MSYDLKIQEEELKNKVADDYFKNFDSTRIIEQIDFCIAKKMPKKDAVSEYYLWAEAKKGNKHDIYESFIQLILTIGKGRIYDKHLPPSFLGAFDAEKIAFLPYYKIMDIFSQSDFNWNVTPSNHNSKEFKQLYKIVHDTLESESFKYKFGLNDKEIKDFIKNNFKRSVDNISKVQIDKNNFVNIYSKWVLAVKNSISIDWDMAKQSGIIDADFYLADLLSRNNLTLKQKLFVILKTNYYELERNIDKMGFMHSRTAYFYDKQKAHKEFWKKYQRPPKTEYWDYIINRRDLLVPQDIRERKGSFFTPQIWVEKSQDYMAEALGENWQDEYYIWDLAAGTGNLLAGLTNKYNIWASTIDQADVDIMVERVRNGANLLESHIFKFDFLNDSFDKLPKELKKIIEEKPDKLVIYINPPYAEATSSKSISERNDNLHKAQVATETKIYKDYLKIVGKANRELYIQFFIRIYLEIPNCILCSFSTLKYVNSSNLSKFRETFKAKFLKGFICPAKTFDNVGGDFPIGFSIWDTSKKERIDTITVDILDKAEIFLGKKYFYSFDSKDKNIKDWLREFNNSLAVNSSKKIGHLVRGSVDFQNNNVVFITLTPSQSVIDNSNENSIFKENLIINCIFFAVRRSIDATWINHNDQFLYPNDKWEEDKEFQNDCLTFALFHGQNRISASEGVNHWIPFNEREVGAKNSFESHFMKDFLDGKIKINEQISIDKNNEKLTRSDNLFETENKNFIPKKPLKFSTEAKEVFEAGKKLWKYYHSSGSYINANASFYDIRKYFQKVDEKSGRMKNKSMDEEYNKLIKDLREKMNVLAKKIEPKIYEYGFLRK